MPFSRPSIGDLIQQQTVEISTQLNIAREQVEHSNASVIAKTQAGAVHGLHGHLAFLIDQNFEDTATIEYLRRRGAIRGIFEKAATKATGQCTVTGLDGSAVIAGTLLQSISGERFVVTIGAVILNGTATLSIESVNSGVQSNTAANTRLNFVTPIPGVESNAISGKLIGGSDDESIESYRARVLAEIREPAQGGADSDYIRWIREVPGVNVDRVWVMRKWMGSGTVGVFFTVDNGAIPSAETVEFVQDYVVDRVDAKAPITADVFILAPTPVAVPIVVNGLIPDTPTVRQAAEFELMDLFSRTANVENGNGSGKVLLSHLREAISIASGERDHVVVTPNSNVTFNAGELPIFGGVTWTQ